MCVFACVCVCVIFPFGFESGMWDLIVLIPDHCLLIYFSLERVEDTDCFNIDSSHAHGLIIVKLEFCKILGYFQNR